MLRIHNNAQTLWRSAGERIRGVLTRVGLREGGAFALLWK